MSAEHLTSLPVGELCFLAFAISLFVKQKLKAEQRPDIPTEDLEIDHIVPRYKGGDSLPDNLQAVTRVEHAQKHLQDAFSQKDNWQNARRDFGAVRLIVRRMKDDELENFNDSINQ